MTLARRYGYVSIVATTLAIIPRKNASAAVSESDDDDDIDEDEEPAPKEWDEGGKSHCGYGDSVHETLMSIGESIHKVVGEPNEGVQTAMKGIGNWFQEASYAARDLRRGKMDILAEDTQEAMKSVVSGDEDEAEGEKDEDEDKLKPVKEDESQKDGVTA
mmetsp:Transcript_8752/g.14140  ORF Transcript_8752/g.14140 Transcript_8752/m.14140 type:complete len:160 (-) Transcript_8752:8-487(-)